MPFWPKRCVGSRRLSAVGVEPASARTPCRRPRSSGRRVPWRAALAPARPAAQRRRASPHPGRVCGSMPAVAFRWHGPADPMGVARGDRVQPRRSARRRRSRPEHSATPASSARHSCAQSFDAGSDDGGEHEDAEPVRQRRAGAPRAPCKRKTAAPIPQRTPGPPTKPGARTGESPWRHGWSRRGMRRCTITAPTTAMFHPMSCRSADPIRHTASGCASVALLVDHAVEQSVATESQPGEHEQPHDQCRESDRPVSQPCATRPRGRWPRRRSRSPRRTATTMPTGRT